MPIFKCSKCGVIDNTATGNYWTDTSLSKKPPLCTECDPAIGKWHGYFERRLASETGLIEADDGFLHSPEEITGGRLNCFTGKPLIAAPVA